MISLLVEPQADGVSPVVHRRRLVDALAAETWVQRQRRLVQAVHISGRVDGRGAGWQDARVVRTRAGTVAATAPAARNSTGAAGADGAAVRGRVPGIAAGHCVSRTVAPAPAPGAMCAALHTRYALQVGRVRCRRPVLLRAAAVPGPHRPRYAVLVHVDDALFDGRQPRRWRPQLHATADRRPVRWRRRRRRRPPTIPQALGRRRRVFVQARMVRVWLAFVPGTAALVVPRPMLELVVHVNRINSVMQQYKYIYITRYWFLINKFWI